MLVLGRRKGESVLIGKSQAAILAGAFVRITIVEHNGLKARLAIGARKDVRVIRAEILESDEPSPAIEPYGEPLESIFAGDIERDNLARVAEIVEQFYAALTANRGEKPCPYSALGAIDSVLG